MHISHKRFPGLPARLRVANRVKGVRPCRVLAVRAGETPLKYGTIVAAYRDAVRFSLQPPHVRDVTAMPGVLLVRRVLDDARGVEELDGSKVIGGHGVLSVAGEVQRVDVGAVGGVGPDAHDGKAEHAGPGGPLRVRLDCVSARANDRPFVDVPVDNLVAPAVGLEELAVRGPVKVRNVASVALQSHSHTVTIAGENGDK